MKFIFALVITFLFSIAFSFKDVSAESIQEGVSVDIARKEYSLESLKQIVDTIHENNGQYLQLHFSDDENYAIESDYFSHQGIPNENYLTKAEIKSLIAYSNELDVMVVPDIDFPSHSKALLSLIQNEDKYLYNQIISDYSDNTFDFFSNDKALSISKRQIGEITTLFNQPKYNGQQRIVLGGDEVPGGGAYQSDFISYMNQIGSYATGQGYEPQMWNDMISHEGIKSLSDTFSILYWKQNENSKSDLTVEDFAEYDFKIYNYNFYSLYFLPSNQFTNADIEEQADYISWAYAYNKFFYTNEPYQEVDSDNVKGSALSFWGEDALNMSQTELINQEIPLIKAYLSS